MNTLAAIISSIGSVVTAAATWITTYLGVITAEGNEILLLFVLFGFVGTGIGLIKRLTTL